MFTSSAFWLMMVLVPSQKVCEFAKHETKLGQDSQKESKHGPCLRLQPRASMRWKSISQRQTCGFRTKDTEEPISDSDSFHEHCKQGMNQPWHKCRSVYAMDSNCACTRPCKRCKNKGGPKAGTSMKFLGQMMSNVTFRVFSWLYIVYVLS